MRKNGNTMGYYSAVEKEKILLFITTSIDLEDIYARRKKSDGERQMLYVLSYTGNLCKSLAGRYGAGNRRLSEFGIRVPLAGPPPPHGAHRAATSPESLLGIIVGSEAAPATPCTLQPRHKHTSERKAVSEWDSALQGCTVAVGT